MLHQCQPLCQILVTVAKVYNFKPNGAVLTLIQSTRTDVSSTNTNYDHVLITTSIHLLLLLFSIFPPLLHLLSMLSFPFFCPCCCRFLISSTLKPSKFYSVKDFFLLFPISFINAVPFLLYVVSFSIMSSYFCCQLLILLPALISKSLALLLSTNSMFNKNTLLMLRNPLGNVCKVQ